MVQLPLIPLASHALPDMLEYVLLEALPGEPLSDGSIGLREPLVP